MGGAERVQEGREGHLPMILGPSEDTWAPGGLIADDKVTRLRVNPCYLHLITVSCALVPAGPSPLHSAC